MSEERQEQVPVNIEHLVKLAFFLEGFKLGNGGNIVPLGNVIIENLWNVIHYLRGNPNYYNPEEK